MSVVSCADGHGAASPSDHRGVSTSVSPSTSAPSVASTSDKRLGISVQVRGWRLRVESIDEDYPGERLVVAQPGNRLVEVVVSVTNTGDFVETFSTLLISVRDSTGRVFNSAPTLFLSTDVWRDQDFAPGSSRTGPVVFEVPDSSRGLVLVFRAAALSDPVTVALG